MRSLVLSLLCVFAVVYVACKSSSNPVTSSTPPASYFPMAAGNVWVYHNWQVDSTGAAINDQIEVDSVTDSTTFQGKRAWHILPTINDTAQQEVVFAFDSAGNPETYVDT